MDAQTRENWRKIKAALEGAGKTNCHFYRRAIVICNGGNDPMEHPFNDQSKTSSLG